MAFTTTSNETGDDIWVRDLARGIDTRLTFDPGTETDPRWIDSSRLSYVEATAARSRIFAVQPDGSGGKRLLASEVGVGIQQALLAPDGASAVRIIDVGGHKKLRSASVQPDGVLGPPQEFLQFQPEPDIGDARLSPDGRLLAYATDDPGPARGVPHALSLGPGPLAGQPGGRAPRRAGPRGPGRSTTSPAAARRAARWSR